MRISETGERSQPAFGHFLELLAIVGDAAPGAAQGEGGADDERETGDLLGNVARLGQGMGGAADRHVQPDGNHQVFEHLPVLTALDGRGVGADHFHAVFFKDAVAEQGHGGVQGGLAAQGWEQDQFAPGPQGLELLDLAGNHLLDALRCNGPR